MNNHWLAYNFLNRKLRFRTGYEKFRNSLAEMSGRETPFGRPLGIPLGTANEFGAAKVR